MAGGTKPGGPGSGPDSDKTVFDPDSPLHLQGSDNDKTVLDPQSPIHRAGAAAPSDAEKTVMLAELKLGPREQSLAAARAAAAAPPPAAGGAPAAKPAQISGGPAADSLSLPVGFRLHEYRIDAVLGQGGFGITYLATDVNLNAKVAVKEYLPEDFAYRVRDNTVSARTPNDLDFYQTGLDSFLVEARTLATFRHPHIVRVARFFEAHNTAYMVLEYERGQSLKTWRKTHAEASERELLTLMLPLLDGLAVVHESGYLHRDIKPDNIYVRDEDGSLVLLDFGAARQTAGGGDAEQGSVFTPGYGPIEQYGDTLPQGPWTDIYAFGATLFWFLTGKKPIEASQRISGEDPLPPAAEICKGKYSPEFLRAIDWALKPMPSDRPKDIAQFRAALYAAHASSLGLQEALRAGDEADGGGKTEGFVALLTQPKLFKKRILRMAKALARPASWPIAVKMTIAMVCTALLPMIITAYYNLDGSIKSVSRGELRNLEQLAQSTAGRISQLLNDSRNLANYLGTDDDFVGFLVAPTEPGKMALKSKLEALIKANPDVQLAMVMDTTGTAVVSSDAQVMGRNFKFREYFKVAMEGKPFITGIVVGAVAGQAGIFYSNPVYDSEKKVIGAVVLRILASSVVKILQEAQQGTQRAAFLIDGDGIVIHHPDESLLYSSLVTLKPETLKEIIDDQRFRRKEIKSLNMTVLAKAMVGNRQGGNVSYFSTISKADEIAGYSPVLGHDWVVAVSETRDYFEAPLNDLFLTVLYSVFVVGMVFLLLAMLFARSIVRPIEELTAAAHALKSGDYDHAHITVKTNDEIGQLARTFNVLIDVLRQRERERGGRRGKSQAAPKA